jgi:hypothetical protein
VIGKHSDTGKLFVSEIARVSRLRFAHEDRLSRAEAEQVLTWAQGNPEVMAAYTDPSHPGHQEVNAYSQMAFMYAHDFPQTENGEPMAWEQVSQAAGEPASEAEAQDDDPFAGWSAQQARDRIEASLKEEKYAQYRAAQADRAHPDHDLANREIARLYEIAYPERPAEPSPSVNPAGAAAPSVSGTPAAGAAPGAPLGQAAALKRIDELYADPAFIARSESADRQVSAAASAEAAGLFQIAYPEAAPDIGGDNGAAPAAGDGAA